MNINEKIQWWKDHPPYFITKPDVRFVPSRRSGKSSLFIRQLKEKMTRKELEEKVPCLISLDKEDFDEFIKAYIRPLDCQKIEGDANNLDGYTLHYFDETLNNEWGLPALIASCFVDGCDDASYYMVCANWDECYQPKKC